jgi:hypothetical protein
VKDKVYVNNLDPPWDTKNIWQDISIILRQKLCHVFRNFFKMWGLHRSRRYALKCSALKWGWSYSRRETDSGESTFPSPICKKITITPCGNWIQHKLDALYFDIQLLVVRHVVLYCIYCSHCSHPSLFTIYSLAYLHSSSKQYILIHKFSLMFTVIVHRNDLCAASQNTSHVTFQLSPCLTVCWQHLISLECLISLVFCALIAPKRKTSDVSNISQREKAVERENNTH